MWRHKWRNEAFYIVFFIFLFLQYEQQVRELYSAVVESSTHSTPYRKELRKNEVSIFCECVMFVVLNVEFVVQIHFNAVSQFYIELLPNLYSCINDASFCFTDKNNPANRKQVSEFCKNGAQVKNINSLWIPHRIPYPNSIINIKWTWRGFSNFLQITFWINISLSVRQSVCFVFLC